MSADHLVWIVKNGEIDSLKSFVEEVWYRYMGLLESGDGGGGGGPDTSSID